jgi:putative hemolysin
MNELQPYDIVNFNNFNKRTEIFFNFLNKFIKFKKVKEIYKEHSYKAGLEFIDAIFDELNLKAEIDDKELAKIPDKGPFIIVSNFPLGGLEALALAKTITQKRKDFRIVATARFHEMGPLEEITFPINQSGKKTNEPCISCAKKILSYIKDGGSVAFFPAIGPASYSKSSGFVIDNQWNTKLTKIIKIAKVPVIPVFFNDSFRKLYHLLGNLHPVLQSFLIQKEMLKKKDTTINYRIGRPIKVTEQEGFSDIWRYTRFLRARVYALGASTPVDVNKFFKYKKKFKLPKAEPIIDPVDPAIVEKEINQAKENYLLHKNGDFEIIAAPYEIFPNVLTEIGRLREITFREVGEGTNKSLDIDEYDLYYLHLVIWDSANKKIVGAYRMGLGDEIIDRFSIKGFYVSTLFKIKKGLIPFLRESVEMGRSFIVKEYQRKPLSLFLLWKGIFYFLLKNPQYRYLIGPVSISEKFTELSKNLIVSFFEMYYFNKEMAKFVKPRKKYKVEVEEFDKNILLESIGNNISKLDNYIKEIEPDSGRMPVLFKKYFGLGGQIIAFNVDPKFNNCLDGLIVVDIFDAPIDIIKSFAKDLNDPTVLERFNFDDSKI